MTVMVPHPFFTALTALLLFFFDSSGTAFRCALAMVLHELGHAFMLALCNRGPIRFTVSIGGIMLEKNGCYITQRQQALILAAGPGINLALAGGSYWLLCRTATFFRLSFCVVNLFLGLFNLLPLWFLDGGQLLQMSAEKIFSQRGSYIFLWVVNLLTAGGIITVSVFFVSGHSLAALCFLGYGIHRLWTDFLKEKRKTPVL